LPLDSELRSAPPILDHTDTLALEAGVASGLRRSRGCTVLLGWVVGGGIAQPTGAAGVGVTWQTCWVASFLGGNRSVAGHAGK
jgi:hypothetical protein